MKHFIGFARVSSREQQREGFSLECQTDAISRHAARLGGSVLKMFAVAESAKDSEARTRFREMLEFAVKNKSQVAGLIFKSVDRAHRNGQDMASLETVFEQHGIPSYIVDGNLDSSDPSSELSIGVQGAVARFNIRQLAEKSMEARTRRVEAGLFPNKAPYGYRNVRENSGKSIVVTDSDAAAVVQRMFELFAQGDMTLDKLLEQLKKEGHTHKTPSQRFTRSKVHTVLRDRSYVGEIRYRDAWHPGTHEPLVSRSVFARVQQLLGERRYGTHDLLFGGLIQCGECGRQVTGEVKRKASGQYVYYRCSRYNAPGHGRDRVTEKSLDRQIKQFLEGLCLDDKELRDWFVAVLRERTKQQRSEAKSRRSRIQTELTKVHDREDRLLDMHLAGDIEKDHYHRKAQQLRDRAAELETELADEGEEQLEHGETAAKAFELAEQLAGKWTKADRATKRLILDVVSLNRVLTDGSLALTATSPFDLLLPEGVGGNGRSERI